jgi:hypothetical protein
MLICEGIFVLEAYSTLFAPQTIRIGSLAMGNPTVAKPNMYYINCYYTNHNVETCRSKKKDEPTIAITKTTF